MNSYEMLQIITFRILHKQLLLNPINLRCIATLKTLLGMNKQLFLDEDILNHIQFDQERNLSYLPISTASTLKRKRHMYHMPIDFAKITLDGLIDTGDLTMAISEQDLNKIKLLASEALRETVLPPNFQIMGANGQLEVPISTVLLEFEVTDSMLSNPLIGVCHLNFVKSTHRSLFSPTKQRSL